jgi:aliphatic nitrilase
MGRTVKVAAAQLAPVFLNREGTVAKACAAILEAGANGAQLVALPEVFIPGYPYWAVALDPMSIGSFNRRLFHAAVEMPGPATEALCSAARKAKCHAVVGMTEREGGTLYNTQLVIGATGEILGRRRKLMPTSHERMVWGRGDGADLTVWRTPLGTLGGLICYEHSNALYRYALQAQGEEIHVACWPGGLGIDRIIDAAVRHYAFEGQCFVVNVTGLVTGDIIAALGPGENAGRLKPGGGYSAIVGPRGDFLAGPVENEEGLIYAELDFDRIVDMKMIVDSAGHYARPDVVRLHLDGTPQRPLVIEPASQRPAAAPAPQPGNTAEVGP